MDETRCSAISAALGEPVWATASIVHSWLFLEQPGPWGRDALLESRLPESVARALAEAAARHHVRVVLVRQPDRRRGAVRHCWLAHTARDRRWVEHRVLTRPGEVLDVDFAALGGGRPPRFGDPWSGPLYLVCTNGRHDPCCARLGRPVVRALLAGRPDAAWECSHIGGDRFAGNLVCLPDGLYFGRLGAAEVGPVVEGYERGLIDLDHYRGRAGDPFPVQAAEYFLRRDQGLIGIGDVVPRRRTRLARGLVEVEFDLTGGRRVAVHVMVSPADSRRLTCTAPHEGHPLAYTLVDLFPRDGTGPAVH